MYGSKCKYKHDANASENTQGWRHTKPCKYYQSSKGCSKGASCTFLHEDRDAKKNASFINEPTKLPERKIESVGELAFRKWRYMVPQASGVRSRPLDLKELSEFFKTALHLMSSDEPDIKYKIIISLATEGGLARVAELTAMPLGGLAFEEQVSCFEQIILPFCSLLTHKHAMSSLLLENAVGTVYNFLFGPSGQRAISFFQSLARLLHDMSDHVGLTRDLLLTSLSSVLAVLAEVLDRNQTACINLELHRIIDVFFACIEDSTTEVAKDIKTQPAYRNFQKIQTRIAMGAAMPSWQPALAVHGRTPAAFDIRQDLPGCVAGGGPRHDNDHANICRIKIMPTAEEIASDYPEYVPASDPQTWHRQGIQGLLDRQFRLLREDTVGQLRDSVRLAGERLRDSKTGDLDLSSKSHHGTRMFLYSGVSIADVRFDKLKGLLIYAEFDQPSVVSRMNTRAERLFWWCNSKQLITDSLLCLTDSRGRATFLSVVERGDDIRDNRGQQKQSTPNPADIPASWQTVDDANTLEQEEVRTLSNNRKRAVITLKLVETKDEDISHILGRYRNPEPVNLALVEFPGVLLPSFRPTLRALQSISSRGEVPFSDVIVPAHPQPANQEGNTTPVQPPLYSLRQGFQFDLSDIADGKPMHLSPHDRFDFTSLLRSSKLDESQCRALLSALTNSFALIQGPPGTGKSFVALQTVKVLLRNREQAELGPIICV